MTVVQLKRSARADHQGGARVRALAERLDDAALVSAIQRGDRAAAGELFDRHAPRVRRVLVRVLGSDPDIADLLQEVFVHALRDLPKLSDPNALGGWLNAIAVNLARRTIRKRTRWRWLRPAPPEELSAVPVDGHDENGSEELVAVYRILGAMHADERIAFALRFIEGMELKEVAAACDVSLATIKRRLARAESFFKEHAKADPALQERLAKSEGRQK
ncbi:MAG: sigma-70 family RNA polymerase sigma factor [Polyangiaceae bacterium]|nr:sigma-70 family RNA polymerase sigma factor [Polyangiaceae bacterium]